MFGLSRLRFLSRQIPLNEIDGGEVVSFDVVSHNSSLCHLLRHGWTVIVVALDHQLTWESLLALMAKFEMFRVR